MALAGTGVRFLEATPDGRGYLIEIEGGPHHGDLVFVPGPPPPHLLEGAVGDGGYVPPPRRYADLTPTEQREAQATAERLLLSLLDERQVADYRATGGFWVELADGRLRLGTLYHLVWQPRSGPDVERILCVVPDGHDEGLTPPADIWTNLLLAVHADPQRFFSVANVRRVSRRSLSNEAPAFASIDLEALAELARNHYRHGDWWSGAMAEHALARRHATAGRRRTALKCAVPAALSALVAEPPPLLDGGPLRDQLHHTARSLLNAAGPGGGGGLAPLVEDLVEAADRRLRVRRPDLGARIDRAAAGLRIVLAT